ncbi:MAG TPA: SH3 domain-containing protein [Clostridia bacterium]|nr:SH3 domain-containing protein [Clostridia bacterium]
MSLPPLPPAAQPAAAPEPEKIYRGWPLPAGLALCFVLGLVLAWLYPGFTTVVPEPRSTPTLIWHGTEIEGKPVIMQEDTLYFHVPTLQSLLDPNMHWDREGGYLAITTKDRVIQLHTEQLTWYINQAPVDLRFPVLVLDGEPYLDLEPLRFLYQLDVSYVPGTDRVVVRDTKEPYLDGEITGKKSYLRIQPSIRAPRLTELVLGDRVIILQEEHNWFKVQTIQGLIGYVPEKDLAVQAIAWVPAPPSLEQPPWKPLGGKISLVWEQVTHGSHNPKPEVLGPLTGVNVYSPTWFHLADAGGNINSYANLALVEEAHRAGKQVWALFSNSFDPEMTAAFLRNPEARSRAIKQLVVLARLYHLDGINIDFENIPPENKDLLVQFVRELAPILREQGLIVSMDVTFKSDSGNWSLIYDRKALGEAVDYLAVMAYDEHWATSPVPGSVASLPWVERGLRALLEEVPPQKILLGIPLYARIWTVAGNEAEPKVTSRAWSMRQTQKWLQENRLEPILDPATGQHFAELEQDGQRYLLWLEDEVSLQQRIELVHKYGLAGIAAWQRGFAKEEIWPAIKEYLKN